MASQSQLKPASAWILDTFFNLQNQLDQHLNDYELTHSVQALYTFLWDEFADWYVEYLKTDETQINFAHELFRQFIIILHPYMPFETEVLWKEYFGEENLLATTKIDQTWLDSYTYLKEDVKKFEIIIDFVRSLRSLRGLFAIDPALYLEVYSQSQLLTEYSDFIKLVARCQIKSSSKEGLYMVNSPQYSYAIDIDKIIKNKYTEISRTNKIINDLEKQIDQLESQLSNDKFINNAEPEVVLEKRNNLSQRRTELIQQQNKILYLTA